jgi:hypothetical protein
MDVWDRLPGLYTILERDVEAGKGGEGLISLSEEAGWV